MKCENCPEVRCEIAEKSRRGKTATVEPKKVEKSTPKLFSDNGRPYCLNLARLDFTFHDEADHYELNLHVYKFVRQSKSQLSNFISNLFLRFLDSSLIDVDAQPNYVRVTVKGKIFQMALNDEIHVSASTSKRSQTTGHLLITMPKLNPENCLTFKAGGGKSSIEENRVVKFSSPVNIRNIVVDESEVPPLI